jgi:hypothetical protein
VPRGAGAFCGVCPVFTVSPAILARRIFILSSSPTPVDSSRVEQLAFSFIRRISSPFSSIWRFSAETMPVAVATALALFLNACMRDGGGQDFVHVGRMV